MFQTLQSQHNPIKVPLRNAPSNWSVQFCVGNDSAYVTMHSSWNLGKPQLGTGRMRQAPSALTRYVKT